MSDAVADILNTGTGQVDVSSVTTAVGPGILRQRFTQYDPVQNQGQNVDTHGSAQVLLYNAAGNPLQVNPSDAIAGTTMLATAGMLWDDIAGNFIMARGTAGGTALVSGNRTSTTASSILSSFGKRSAVFLFFPTALSGTTFTLDIIGSFASPGTAIDLGRTATMTVAQNHVGLVFVGEGSTAPTAVAAGNVDFATAFAVALPPRFQIQMIPSNNSGVTYSVTYLLM